MVLVKKNNKIVKKTIRTESLSSCWTLGLLLLARWLLLVLLTDDLEPLFCNLVVILTPGNWGD